MYELTKMPSYHTTAFAAPVLLRPHHSRLQPHLTQRPVTYRPATTTPRTRRAPTARVRRGKTPEPVIPDNLYGVTELRDIDNVPVDFSIHRDRVVLVLNVASEDNRSDAEYKVLASLIDRYHKHGLDIVVFPCNWFGQYETGSHEEIKKFVHSNYSDRIKVMLKQDIEWNQVFALARKYFPGEIIWNFHGKFLYGRKGLPVARFDLLTSPEYLEEQVSHFVHNPDPSIHTAAQPTDVDDYDDNWYLFQDEIEVPAAVVPVKVVEEEEEEEENEEADEEADPKLKPIVDADDDSDTEENE